MADLNMTIGDTRQFRVSVSIEGAPLDLTGVQALTFTLERTGGSVVARWGIGSGVAIPSPATGQALLTVTAAMLSWASGYMSLRYYWSLTDAFGNVTGVLESGSFQLAPPTG